MAKQRIRPRSKNSVSALVIELADWHDDALAALKDLARKAGHSQGAGSQPLGATLVKDLFKRSVAEGVARQVVEREFRAAYKQGIETGEQERQAVSQSGQQVEIKATAEGSAESYGISDDGQVDLSRLAEAVLQNDLFRDRLKFDIERGLWYRLSERGIWLPDTIESTPKAIQALMSAFAFEADPEPTSKPRCAVSRKSALEAVVNLIRRDIRVGIRGSRTWDRDIGLFADKLGVWDLRKGKRLEPSEAGPRNVSRRCPVEISGDELPPAWATFLSESLGAEAEEYLRFLQLYLGYLMTGLVTERLFMVVIGPTASGKSTFAQALSRILGRLEGGYSWNIAAEVLMERRADRHRSELAQLDGPRFIYFEETPRGAAFRSDLLKSISAGGQISGQWMYKNPFHFSPQCKVMMTANEMPRLFQADSAVADRLAIVRFSRSIANKAERDRKLERRLVMEGGQLLGWAMTRCPEIMSDPSIVSAALPASATESARAWHEEQDSVRQFLNEQLYVPESRNGPPIRIAKTLYPRYRGWAKNTGVREELSMVEFRKRLRQLAHPEWYDYIKGTENAANSPVIVGLCWRADLEDEENPAQAPLPEYLN